MKHSNISIFVPHAGCPRQCSFCDQKAISGVMHQPTADEVHEICRKAMSEITDRENCEIAFFGGSFTAIERDYMMSLLEAAVQYVGNDKFKGIRISTRPDSIDGEILHILKEHGVTAIELGAQSMKNKVLEANERGHDVQAVYKASELIREYGFELGLQMMVGLYKSTATDELDTMDRIIKIQPDTVRIYPVAVLKNTKLEELYRSGEYSLMPFDDVVELCARMLREFENRGINVIKCGLHASEFVEQDMVAGFYHPAFRELCESRIYRFKIQKLIIESNNDIGVGKALKRIFKGVTIAVNPSCISKAAGHKRSNVEYFKDMGLNIKIIGDDDLKKYQAELRG